MKCTAATASCCSDGLIELSVNKVTLSALPSREAGGALGEHKVCTPAWNQTGAFPAR